MQSDNSARLPEIDFLRGIALFGILVVNVWIFSVSFIAYGEWSNNFSETIDPVLVKLSSLLVEQRFIGIFSLLFGLGIAVQKMKFDKRQISFSSHYFNRVFVLAILGVINILFFFWGDILLIYSILSILLYIFFKFSNKTLLISSFLIFFIPAFLFLIPSVREFFQHYEEGILNYYSSESLTKSYQSGTFVEMLTARVREYISYNSVNLLWQRTSLALMLLGYLIGRNNLHMNYLKYFGALKIALVIILIYCLAFVSYTFIGNQTLLSPNMFFILYNIFIPLSTFVYVIVLLIIYNSKVLGKLKLSIANLGKLSLSNYFFQSIICSFIFTNYGLGLYFKTTPSYNLLICISVFTLQLILTNFYLTKFKTGPLEILLRKFTNDR